MTYKSGNKQTTQSRYTSLHFRQNINGTKCHFEYLTFVSISLRLIHQLGSCCLTWHTSLLSSALSRDLLPVLARIISIVIIVIFTRTSWFTSWYQRRDKVSGAELNNVGFYHCPWSCLVYFLNSYYTDSAMTSWIHIFNPAGVCHDSVGCCSIWKQEITREM